MSSLCRSVGIHRGMRLKAQPRSSLEVEFDLQMRAMKFPTWAPEYRFLEHRKYRIDRAWPNVRFGVEIDGGVHKLESRFHSDREKHALALLEGWRILPVTSQHVRDGRAIAWAAELLFRALFPGEPYRPDDPFSSHPRGRLSVVSDSNVGAA